MSNNWTKCYEDGWKDHIVPEAFSHPAKMAYGLLKRILSHCKDEGWGGVIVDPFGGIGSTGILGAYEGYQVICVELEAKFVNLAKENFELHRKAWEQFGNPYPVIIRGDSRKLCEAVEVAELIISSPPFAVRQPPAQIEFEKLSKTQKDEYGNSPGQLGSMKAGKVDMVISSPPYAETFNESKHTLSGMAKRDKRIAANFVGGYGSTPGNLGNLKAGDVDLILSSPPYEGSEGTFSVGKAMSKAGWDGGGGIGARAGMDAKYGNSKGQLGHTQGPTFWQAAKEIVHQCYQILRPGGHAIWVCKDFVRKGQRVPFSDDWQRLCESVGFKTLHRHKAMLVKETKYESLFGHDIVKKTERKSFFRRLAEAKGSPKIDWEDVICMTRR